MVLIMVILYFFYIPPNNHSIKYYMADTVSAK
nr:MAG TPA: hypothetical protein [Caudoviricetes sp.]